MLLRTLFVRPVPRWVFTEDLRRLFSLHGDVESVRISRKKHCGFVLMSTSEQADKAAARVNNTRPWDRILTVKKAGPMKDKPSAQLMHYMNSLKKNPPKSNDAYYREQMKYSFDQVSDPAKDRTKGKTVHNKKRKVANDSPRLRERSDMGMYPGEEFGEFFGEYGRHLMLRRRKRFKVKKPKCPGTGR